MKTTPKLTLVVFIVLSLFSCKKGKFSDNIQLSGKEFSFSAERDSVLITTRGKGGWLTFAKLDSTYTHIPTNAGLCDFEYADSSFQIVRKSYDTLIVKMNENNTNAFRLLTIGLEAGDYFDAVQIKQAKK